MAEKTHIESTDPTVNAMDYAEHEGTYGRVMSMTKWGIISLAILVVLLYILIRP